MTTRERVQELRGEGLRYREIAQRLGISLSHARHCGSPGTSYDSTLAASRAAKRRRTGICEDCGTETRYNGHREKVSRFCPACAAIRTGAAQKVWTRARIIAAIQWWADTYGRPPAIPDFNPARCRHLKDGQREARAKRHIAAHQIPWFTSVVLEFGTWSNGIAAAGFQPLAPNGGGGNIQRRRKVAA